MFLNAFKYRSKFFFQGKIRRPDFKYFKMKRSKIKVKII